MLIDTHAHLHVSAFDQDREAVIKRAREAGIGKLINVGFDVEGNFQAIALARKYDWMYATMGIHPHLASDWNDAVGAKIEDAVKRESKIVALGEMGLDYYKNFQPPELQKKVFREQLKLAKKLDLPVIIHCREAFADAFKILDEEKIERVLLHCFTGTATEAEEGLKRGFFLAFTGIITYASAGDLRKVVASCPINKIFIETDCPFLTPQKHRGRRNEPAYTREIYEKVASIKKMPQDELEIAVAMNMEQLF